MGANNGGNQQLVLSILLVLCLVSSTEAWSVKGSLLDPFKAAVVSPIVKAYRRLTTYDVNVNIQSDAKSMFEVTCQSSDQHDPVIFRTAGLRRYEILRFKATGLRTFESFERPLGPVQCLVTYAGQPRPTLAFVAGRGDEEWVVRDYDVACLKNAIDRCVKDLESVGSKAKRLPIA